MTQGVKDESIISLSEKYQDVETLNNIHQEISHFRKKSFIVEAIKQEILP